MDQIEWIQVGQGDEIQVDQVGQIQVDQVIRFKWI